MLRPQTQRERNVVRFSAAVSGEERCVTTLKRLCSRLHPVPMVIFRARATRSLTVACNATPARSAQRSLVICVSLRLRSVKNIQKITKSMKMVSAAKFGKAERELRPARVYGAGASALYDKVEITPSEADKTKPNNLIVVMSSDRGLCGGIHSNLVKAVKATLAEKGADNVKIVSCGDKARQLFLRTHADNLMMSFSEIGKRPPQFCEATFIAQEIIDSGFQFDLGEMYYNWFKSVVSYRTKTKPLVSFDSLNAASEEVLSSYDDLDSDVIKNYSEFSLASLLYYGMKEGACSEQSSRMTAMDSASKNAGEMIDKLTLTYNRTRQAVITKELIEIISGAAALE